MVGTSLRTLIRTELGQPGSLIKQLRWSSGSMLPLSTQVCGFKPGQRRQDFSGRKSCGSHVADLRRVKDP